MSSRNSLSPKRFVLCFGLVSLLADMVYEGARSITGPYLATFGASALTVGLITGVGEAVALVFRLASGPLSDRTGRHWALSITGYAMTIIAVPCLAVAGALWQVAGLIIGERFGKAVRTPARDTMLAAASTASFGRGLTFAVHEAMDQSGAFLGPLAVAGMIALFGYRAGFAALALPGIFALLTLAWLRSRVPVPSAYEVTADDHRDAGKNVTSARLPRRFWLYAAFTAVSMLGFTTFAVLAYHDQRTKVIVSALIPVTYAMAMGSAALAALGSGWLYNRIGLRGLVVALPLAMLVPILAFQNSPAAVWAGAVVWGAAMGIHESTLRAAVADLVPAARRGLAYGIFTATYGLAWLAGSAIIGGLYSVSLRAVVIFVAATQIAALPLFLWLTLEYSGNHGE